MKAPAESVEVLDSKQRSRWDEVFDQLPPELRDINFSFDYNFLYELNGDGQIRLFLFWDNSSLYFYPFLLRTIKEGDTETGFKDIETVYGYTGPISTSTDSRFIKNAIDSFRNYCHEEMVVCEFIRFHPLLGNYSLNSSDPDLKIVPLRDYVYVDLRKTQEEIWDEYSAQNRNKIRKAERLGVTIIAGFNEESYKEFLLMYLENMRLVHAAPMYFFSDAFFAGLAELVQKKGMFFVAKDDHRILGAAVFLGGAEIGHYFLAAATAEGKKLAAGNLLLHHGIKWSQQNGMKKLHLGGGVSQNPDDPLLVFKNNFSKLTEKFYIGKRVHDGVKYDYLVSAWDKKFPEASIKYNNILQRYRLTKEDLV